MRFFRKDVAAGDRSSDEGSPEKHYPHEKSDAEDLRYGEDLHVPVLEHTTERRLATKIDFRVVPFLCIMYLLAFLDRVNISNAAIFGLQEDLNLPKDSLKFSTALVIFFVPYILFEIPSNLILKKLRPSIWLSVCMFMFGLVMICQGLVTNYGGLLTTRFFLGVFEAGMFPGAFYLLGCWYRRNEAQRRFSFFFSSTTLAGAFGGLLAAAIGKMDGLQGYSGWKWIFILEGVLTCLVSFAFFFLLPDFPEEAKWLSEEERAYLKARLAADQGNSARHRPITTRDVFNVFKDYKVILGGFMYFGLIVPAYSYAYFSPIILKGYGYGNIQTQLHSVPPWAAAFAFAMIIAFLSDKMQHRFLFAIFPICVAIAGFASLLAVHHDTQTQYAMLFLCAMGCYTAMPVIVCWFNLNLGGHHRRAVGSAWQVGFGNIGGIIAVFIFQQRDAPNFTKGYAVCLGFICLSGLSCVAYFLACWSQNRARERLNGDSGLSEEEKTEMGDLSPGYRYQL